MTIESKILLLKQEEAYIAVTHRKMDSIAAAFSPIVLGQNSSGFGKGLREISHTVYGDGVLFSFGFPVGFQYASRTAPHVPLSQRNNELYPVGMMNHQPLQKILSSTVRPELPAAMKDVECSAFEHGWVAVNHRSVPVKLPFTGIWHGSQRMTDGILPARSAVWIEVENT